MSHLKFHLLFFRSNTKTQKQFSHFILFFLFSPKVFFFFFHRTLKSKPECCPSNGPRNKEGDASPAVISPRTPPFGSSRFCDWLLSAVTLMRCTPIGWLLAIVPAHLNKPSEKKKKKKKSEQEEVK